MLGLTCILGDIVKSVSAMVWLREQPLPVVVSLAINRLARALDLEYELYIEAEKELLDRWAEKDENNEIVRVESAVAGQSQIHIRDMANFQQDLNELFELKIQLNVEPILLSSISHIDISPNDLEALLFMLTNDLDVPE